MMLLLLSTPCQKGDPLNVEMYEMSGVAGENDLDTGARNKRQPFLNHGVVVLETDRISFAVGFDFLNR
jgi:hypothetical protein